MITLTTPIVSGLQQSGSVTITGIRIAGIGGDPDLANYVLQLEPHSAGGVVPFLGYPWIMQPAGKAAFTAAVGSGFRGALYAALQADDARFAGVVS